MKRHTRRAHYSAASACLASLLAACGGGGSGSRSPPPPPPDTVAPDTTLSGTPPALTTSTAASFTFIANESGVSFEARLDNAAFAAATSPVNLSGLADGSHTFEVRARDAAGNVDATPASGTWVVDATAPDTSITAGPSSTSAVNNATFSVSATEPNSTLEASVDGGAFAVVTSPHSVSGGVVDGAHTIRFRARDRAGNVDATPASASFILDTTAPTARIRFPARNFYTDASTISVRGTAQDANGIAGVSINGIAAQSPDGFATWSAVVPVPVGTTTLSVSTTDTPGNVASNSATATMINRGPLIASVRGVAYDAARDRVIVSDWQTGKIAAFRASDGIGQMLSDTFAPGQSAGNSLPEGMVVDAANDQLLLVDSAFDALVAVNLATGVRTVISPAGSGGAGTTLQTAYGLALDAANQLAYVTVQMNSCVVRINLANGQRTVASSDSVGTGSTLSNPYGIVFDNVTSPNSPRLLVVTGAVSPGIQAIDPATGDRAPFSTLGVGNGTALNSPVPMTLDAARRRVLVTDMAVNTLFAVDLDSGNRTQVNNANLGSGPFASFTPSGLAVNPQTHQLYSAQNFGAVFAIDLVTQARSALVHSYAGFGDSVNFPMALALEPTVGEPTSLLYLQGIHGMLYRMSLMSGIRHLVSWSTINIGSGPSLAGSVDFVIDRRPGVDGRAVLVLQRDPVPQLLSVDLTTGNRTVVAALVGAGPGANYPTRLVLDVPGNRVLYTNRINIPPHVDQVLAVSLANGASSVVSGESSSTTVGTPPLDRIVLDSATSPTRAFVSDSFSGAIITVDLATGARSPFASRDSGSGISYYLLGPLFLDNTHSQLLYQQVGFPSYLGSMPLAGGTRELISGTHPETSAVRGSGPPQLAVSGMDVDTANDVAYVSSINNQSIMAIDLVSGDRIVIAR